MKNKSTLFLLAAFLITAGLFAQKTETVFNIFLKEKNIGTVRAMEIKSGTKSTKDLHTLSDTKFLCIQVHLEMDMNTISDNGVLVQGTAYKHANRGTEDVHAVTKKTGPSSYTVQRNGETSVLNNKVIRMCVADLYFTEPKGITTVFSNMYAQDVPIKAVGPGKYELTTPNDKTTTYTYQNGKLMTIVADTPAGEAVTKRM